MGSDAHAKLTEEWARFPSLMGKLIPFGEIPDPHGETNEERLQRVVREIQVVVRTRLDDVLLLVSSISVSKEEVLNFVHDLIEKSVSKSIWLTMRSDDDPLPDWYFDLLRRKAEEGVKIRRIGFGNASFFETERRIHIVHPNYSFRFSNSQYQRMLLVDRSKLLFKTAEGIWYTEDHDAISKYIRYFENNWLE